MTFDCLADRMPTPDDGTCLVLVDERGQAWIVRRCDADAESEFTDVSPDKRWWAYDGLADTWRHIVRDAVAAYRVAPEPLATLDGDHEFGVVWEIDVAAATRALRRCRRGRACGRRIRPRPCSPSLTPAGRTTASTGSKGDSPAVGEVRPSEHLGRYRADRASRTIGPGRPFVWSEGWAPISSPETPFPQTSPIWGRHAHRTHAAALPSPAASKDGASSACGRSHETRQ